MMREIKFRAWHKQEKKLYFRGYQKLLYILLCDDDNGKNNGNGIPVKKVGYDDCVMLESSSVIDKNGNEVFEGDVVQITANGKSFTETVNSVADMFKSRRLHPLHSLLAKHGIKDNEPTLEIEVVGNEYEKLSS